MKAKLRGIFSFLVLYLFSAVLIATQCLANQCDDYLTKILERRLIRQDLLLASIYLPNPDEKIFYKIIVPLHENTKQEREKLIEQIPQEKRNPNKNSFWRAPGAKLILSLATTSAKLIEDIERFSKLSKRIDFELEAVENPQQLVVPAKNPDESKFADLSDSALLDLIETKIGTGVGTHPLMVVPARYIEKHFKNLRRMQAFHQGVVTVYLEKRHFEPLKPWFEQNQIESYSVSSTIRSLDDEGDVSLDEVKVTLKGSYRKLLVFLLSLERITELKRGFFKRGLVKELSWDSPYVVQKDYLSYLKIEEKLPQVKISPRSIYLKVLSSDLKKRLLSKQGRQKFDLRVSTDDIEKFLDETGLPVTLLRTYTREIPLNRFPPSYDSYKVHRVKTDPKTLFELIDKYPEVFRADINRRVPLIPASVKDIGCFCTVGMPILLAYGALCQVGHWFKELRASHQK